MDKIKNLDDFLDSAITEKFYVCCYDIIKDAYLAGYDFAKAECKEKSKNNIINLPK